MSVRSELGQRLATGLDAVGLLFWIAGDLVGNFEAGRRGKLPRMRSKELKEVVESIEKESREIRTGKSVPKNPVGFH